MLGVNMAYLEEREKVINAEQRSALHLEKYKVGDSSRDNRLDHSCRGYQARHKVFMVHGRSGLSPTVGKTLAVGA